MPKKSERYLDVRGLKYWFKRDIPAAIRPMFGRTAYMVNLETGDLREARRRRDELARETDRLYADARNGTLSVSAEDRIEDLGESWAKELKESLEDPIRWTARVTGRKPESLRDEDTWDPGELIDNEAAQIEKQHGRAAKERFMGIVHGHVDVDQYLEAYLSEAGLAPKTTNERRNLVKRFAKWAKSEGLALPEITRAKAGSYVSAHIAPLNRTTGKKHLGSVKLYWDYLHARGLVKGRNPWEGQAMPNRARRIERGSRERERPFTTEEIQKLIYSPFPSRIRGSQELLQDAMRIAALSGMRLAEIITLWVSDCKIEADGTGYFDLQQGKTSAAARKVPIHPDLLPAVIERMRGKNTSAMLFHELKGQRDAPDTFGKRFATYREALGVSDKRDGKRRSLVNFHSFRRWFVTEAERAGQQESIIAEVVGHEEGRKSITFSVYSAGPSDDQKRRCVESVRLPRSQGPWAA